MTVLVIALLLMAYLATGVALAVALRTFMRGGKIYEDDVAMLLVVWLWPLCILVLVIAFPIVVVDVITGRKKL